MGTLKEEDRTDTQWFYTSCDVSSPGGISVNHAGGALCSGGRDGIQPGVLQVATITSNLLN